MVPVLGAVDSPTITDMTDVSAIVACGILAALAVFQLLLVLGAPIGRFAWGGAHTVLPTALRLGSVVSIILYGVFAVFILSKAGLVTLVDHSGVVGVGMWVFAIYFSAGVLLNAISRSKRERLLMTPTSAVLAVLFLVVAQA